MGSELSKRYAVEEKAVGCGGHGYLWKVYRARRKKDGFECSVFVFEKALAEKRLKGKPPSMLKQVIEVMRRDVTCLAELAGVDGAQLTKAQAPGLAVQTSFKDKMFAAASEKIGATSITIASATRRCPAGCLQLMETFETRSAMVFVGERVNGTIGNATKGEGDFLHPDDADWRNAELTATEIARGAASICDALTAVQAGGGARPKVHLNVAPESLWIAKTGDWRLGGFGFALGCDDNAPTVRPPYFQPNDQSSFLETNPNVPSGRPRLAYAAPEVTSAPQVDAKADVFSLFAVVYELLKKEPLFPGGDFDSAHRHKMTAAARVSSYGGLDCGFAPPLLRDALSRSLRADPTTRPESSAVRGAPGFHTPAVRILAELDVAPHRDPPTAAAFLGSLATFVAESGGGQHDGADDDPDGASAFETNRSLRVAVVPTLYVAAKAHRGALAAHVALVAIACAQRLEAADFRSRLQGVFDAILAVESDHALRVVVDAAELVLEKADAKWAADVVTAAFVKALRPPTGKAKKNSRDPLYDVALRRLAESTTLDALLAKSSIANPKLKSACAESLVPAIGRIAVEEAHALPLRVLALKAMACTLERPSATPPDVLEKVITPALSKATRTVGGQPALAMCVLGCFDLLATRMPDKIARFVLPALTPMLDERALNLKQFDMVVARVETMLAKVVETRRKQMGSLNPAVGTKSTATVGTQQTFDYSKTLYDDDTQDDSWVSNDLRNVKVPELKPVPLAVPDSVGGDTDPFALGASLPPTSSSSFSNNNNNNNGSSSSSFGTSTTTTTSASTQPTYGYATPPAPSTTTATSAQDPFALSSSSSSPSSATTTTTTYGASQPKQVGIQRKQPSQLRAKAKQVPKLRVAPAPAPAAPSYDPFAATTPPPAVPAAGGLDPFASLGGGGGGMPTFNSAPAFAAPPPPAGDPFAQPSSFGFIGANANANGNDDPFAGLNAPSSFPPPQPMGHLPMQQQHQQQPPPSQGGSAFDFMN